MLSLYSVSKTIGIIIVSGEDSTSIVPIIEGYNFPYSIEKIKYGRKSVQNF